MTLDTKVSFGLSQVLMCVHKVSSCTLSLSLLSLYVLIVLIFRVCLSLVHPFGTLVLYILVQMPNTHTQSAVCWLWVKSNSPFCVMVHSTIECTEDDDDDENLPELPYDPGCMKSSSSKRQLTST